MKNLFKKIALLSLAMLIFGCSKDDVPTTPADYSIVGVWKNTSAVLNGTEQLGGTIKSGILTFVSNGTLESMDYNELNYNNLYQYGQGTYTLSSNNLNMIANVYNSSGTLIKSNFTSSWQITLLTATELQIKRTNTSDVYIKKYVRF